MVEELVVLSAGLEDSDPDSGKSLAPNPDPDLINPERREKMQGIIREDGWDILCGLNMCYQPQHAIANRL
jgi:hypothetical protein